MAANFTGKVIVVTGSASGMGLATSKLLLARGASVGMYDINGSQLQDVYEALGADERPRALTQKVDVTDPVALRSAFNNTSSHFDCKIHGIASYAGTGGHSLGTEFIWETSAQEYAFIMDLNVKGLFNVLSEALNPAGPLQDTGASIVHIGSMYSQRAFPKGAVFTASKHAAIGMVKAAAYEAGQRNIRVNAVLPGPIKTPMNQPRSADPNNTSLADKHSKGKPLERDGETSEVANTVAFLLSDESTYTTGASWTVDGGANA